MKEETLRGILAGGKADCLVRCTTIYRYWCVDKDGREYLSEDHNNPEILRLDGRMLEQSKCPELFAHLNWCHNLPVVNGQFLAGGAQ